LAAHYALYVHAQLGPVVLVLALARLWLCSAPGSVYSPPYFCGRGIRVDACLPANQFNLRLVCARHRSHFSFIFGWQLYLYLDLG